MAGSSLLTLIDDIALLLDDVAAMSKVAVKKTAGVLGDDLALNAEQVTGVATNRELPVVWAVAKGSLVNKAILVPAALAISAVLPAAITPLLMFGGLFLCYEGFEKLAHKLLHSKEEDDKHHEELVAAVANEKVDMVAFEKEKIKGAVRTDFILSAEIIVITLGTVAAAPFVTRLSVLLTIAMIMTVGVYGLVAGIVKLDDLGLHLQKKASKGAQTIGKGLLKIAPILMKFLSIAGTAAMFMVGGGILTHGVEVVGHWIEGAAAGAATVPAVGVVLGGLTGAALNGIAGVIAGAAALAVVTVVKKAVVAARKPSK